MPDTFEYQQELMDALTGKNYCVELHWIMLESKTYSKEYRDFIAKNYLTFRQVLEGTALDAIVITGAPVELLSFNEINYWEELRHIIDLAIKKNMFTFGICWGALAIGNVLGIEKASLDKKVFGVLQSKNVSASHSLFNQLPGKFNIPFSTRAYFSPESVTKHIANGRIVTLAAHNDIPHAILQTMDKRHLLCLGHPEYGVHRLINEWHRDNKKHLNIHPPVGLDLSAPSAYWHTFSSQLFNYWFGLMDAPLHAPVSVQSQ